MPVIDTAKADAQRVVEVKDHPREDVASEASLIVNDLAGQLLVVQGINVRMELMNEMSVILYEQRYRDPVGDFTVDRPQQPFS
jgi:hypothetical protein